MSDTGHPTGAAQTSRRDFIRASSLLVAGGAVTGGLSIGRAAHPHGSDLIRVALVGCGRRGREAAVEALHTAGGPVKLVALADVFPDRLQSCLRHIKGALKQDRGDQCDVPRDRQFVGLDAYQRALETDADLVILATPPGFRPLHFEAAVAAGKHAFLEKPVAVDAPGVRRVLAANEEAKRKNLAVAVGLQRRHETAYRETVARIQEGCIGDIVTLRVYWNSGTGREPAPRQERQGELDYQLRNWNYFTWLCGDHIVEQHVQNLDVGNWLMRDTPVTVNAQGGRDAHNPAALGQIFDHFFCEFTYAPNVKMFSQCRLVKNTWNSVAEHVHATKGHADIQGGKIYSPSGELIWHTRGRRGGHRQEQHDLFTALRAGETPNEADYGARSTMTAILGRMAAYSGQRIAWHDAVASTIALAAVDSLASLDSPAPVQPEGDNYPVAVPGVTRTV
ncbi:MAG: Gfo/Idh/MocA family oxidoreductase [Planctomycetes bacterium]|nr:Gfo/Idh/MocA family oxidoreductase [Planctomycetota bacterium]